MKTPFHLKIALLVLLPAFLSLGLSASGQQPTVPKVTWSYVTRHSKSGDPQTDVTLLIGRQRTLVLHNASGEFSTVSRSEYREKGVPSSALAACSLWWAGAGDDLYAVAHGARVDVYRREVDEGAETQRYRLLKSIPLPVKMAAPVSGTRPTRYPQGCIGVHLPQRAALRIV